MTNQVHSDMLCKDEFLEGAARCFFVCAYADFVEEEEREDDGYKYGQPGGGQDWFDFAPERTPPAAYAAAGELWASLHTLNKSTAPCGVISLIDQAAKADGVEDIDVNDFGHYCAMAALGHGVSWFDSHKPFTLETPNMDCGSVGFAVEAYREN
jgi:hypothetical protein